MLDDRDEPVGEGHRRPMTPSSASARTCSGDRPSSPSTCAVCSPRSGAGPRGPMSAPRTRTGAATVRKRPAEGCSTSGKSPSAAACSSAANSEIVAAGAQVKPCSSSSAPHSASVFCANSSSSRSTISGHVLAPRRDRLEARLGGPLRPADRLAEPRPPVLLGHEQQHPALVGGAVALLQRVPLAPPAEDRRVVAVDQGGRQVRRHRPGGGGQQAGVDDLALAGALDQAQRREHRGRQRQRGGVVALRGPGARRRAARLGDRVGDPAAAEERGDVVPRARGVRPLEPVAGHRGVHQPRVQLQQGGGVQPVLLLPAAEQVGDEHVRARDQPADQVLALRRVDRDRDAALAAVVHVEAGVERGLALRALGLAQHPAHRVAAQRLDLDHVGAEVRQHRRRAGGGHPAGQLDDAHALEGREAAHRPVQRGARFSAKARGPSFASSLCRIRCIASALRRQPSASSISYASRTIARLSRTASGRVGADPLGDLAGLAEHLVGRHEVVDHAEPVRLLGAEPLAGEHQLGGPGRRQRPRQPEQPAGRRDDAPGHLGEPELRVRRRDDEVAGQDQLGAAGQREAGHRGDHRLGARVAHPPGEPALLGGELGPAAGGQRLEVGAGAEVGPRAGEDRDPDLRIGLERRRRLAELAGEVGVDRVALLRPVERDRRDPPVDLVPHGHAVPPR